MTNSDYPMIVQWWKDNRFPVQKFEDLPIVQGELQGLVVSNNNVDLCAGFIIETTISTGVMFEYMVANFKVKDRNLRKQSQVFLIKSVIETCKSMGKKFIFSSIKHPSLIPKYEEAGFARTSKGTTEMIKILSLY